MERILTITEWPPEILPTIGLIVGLALSTGLVTYQDSRGPQLDSTRDRVVPAPEGRREPRQGEKGIILTS
jgi:hypothetical protein